MLYLFWCRLKRVGKLFAVKKATLKRKVHIMIDFIVAAAIYLGLMFLVFFCLSFVTIGVTYAVAAFVRRCVYTFRSPGLALK